MIAIDVTLNASLRGGMALLFAFALAHKLRRYAEFRDTLANYLSHVRPIGGSATAVLAAVVIAMETLVVIACAIPGTSVTAATLACGLLLAYAAAMAANIARGNLILDCGCTWGTSRQPVSSRIVFRNLILAGVAASMALPVINRSMLAVDLASVVFATLALACLYVGANHLLALAQPVHGGSR